jgi:hypothetical protein
MRAQLAFSRSRSVCFDRVSAALRHCFCFVALLAIVSHGFPSQVRHVNSNAQAGCCFDKPVALAFRFGAMPLWMDVFRGRWGRRPRFLLPIVHQCAQLCQCERVLRVSSSGSPPDHVPFVIEIYWTHCCSCGDVSIEFVYSRLFPGKFSLAERHGLGVD